MDDTTNDEAGKIVAMADAKERVADNARAQQFAAKNPQYLTGALGTGIFGGQLKAIALDTALRAHPGCSANTIIEAAKAYHEYLKS